MSTVSDIFRPDGPLAQCVSHYQARAGQVRMANAVERAFSDEHVLFCEAGTGTGKTLAYLIPAILSGKRIVISTATRALQEQVFIKDLPLIERALGRRVPAALMKGLSNYLCLRRYSEFRDSEEGAKLAWANKLNLLDAWKNETDAGDFAELVGLPERDPLLPLVASSSDTRVGQKCHFFNECFVSRMKNTAEAAQLIVVNHHLFFADLALRGPHPGRVLPDYDGVVFDEAHQVEDVATVFFGVRVSQRRVSSLSAETERLLVLAKDPVLGDERIIAGLRQAEQDFFERVATIAGKESRLRVDRDVLQGELYERYLRLDDALEHLTETTALANERLRETPSEELTDAFEGIGKRAAALRESLSTIVDGSDGRITWVDNSKQPALSSSPVDLADTLRERVFNQIPSVVLTSATLATTGAQREGSPSPFSFVRSRLGATETEADVQELVVDSPFDFRSHSLLYLAKDLPLPNDESYFERATQRILELIAAADGGAFVLTTSNRALHQFTTQLRQHQLDRPLLAQGKAPKRALLSAFQASRRAVLVATMGFWEGVDIPGDALRLVVLDKIPFPVPSDPIVQARAQVLEEQGRSSFNDLFVPLAQVALKQGFGRLIRREEDRGVVALLDGRVQKRGYGQRLLSQLPAARRTTDLNDAISTLRNWSPSAHS